MEITEKARQVFTEDRYATELSGIEIVQVTEREVCCAMEIKEQHCNAKGFVMGGAIFTLADFAFAIAANYECIVGEEEVADVMLRWVSISSDVRYLSASKEGRLIAKTKKIKSGRQLSVYQIHITNAEDKQIALITTTGMYVE